MKIDLRLLGSVNDGVTLYTVPSLPVSADEGTVVYVTDGRKIRELAGAGTGVWAYFSNGVWRVFSSDSPVTS